MKRMRAGCTLLVALGCTCARAFGGSTELEASVFPPLQLSAVAAASDACAGLAPATDGSSAAVATHRRIASAATDASTDGGLAVTCTGALLAVATGASARCAVHGDSVFTNPAIFERLSHFKDYGVPGTVNDPFNRAAIADGSCRMLNQTGPFEFFHHNQDRVTAVITALAALPATDRPSLFTLSARTALPSACASRTTGFNDLNFYDMHVVAGSVQNWYEALCVPLGLNPDPAFMPQQQALTLGFVCIIACDAGGQTLHTGHLAAIAASDRTAAQAVAGACKEMPWGAGRKDFFSSATSLSELRGRMEPWARATCRCEARRAGQTAQ